MKFILTSFLFFSSLLEAETRLAILGSGTPNPDPQRMGSSYAVIVSVIFLYYDLEMPKFVLNTVMLLNPKNEEAIYNLAKLKLDSSDYQKSIELTHYFHFSHISLLNN